MTPVVAVIPTRFDINYLLNLIPSLSDTSMLYIMDNGLNKDNLDNLKDKLLSTTNEVMIITCPDLSVYEMWNLGWDAAIRDFGNKVHVAILNDDIYFLPQTLSKLSKFLEQSDMGIVCPDYGRSPNDGFAENLVPEYTDTTFGRGGMSGFAFMIKGDLPVRLDTNLYWWYGDDDLVKQVQAIGFKIAKILGIPLAHYQSNSYNFIKNDLEVKIEQDRQYFNKKYGENRQRW